MTLGHAMISQVQNQKHDEENTNECNVIKIKKLLLFEKSLLRKWKDRPPRTPNSERKSYFLKNPIVGLLW